MTLGELRKLLFCESAGCLIINHREVWLKSAATKKYDNYEIKELDVTDGMLDITLKGVK